MIILEYHFEDKDTKVLLYKGKKIIINGCECFKESELDAVCEHYGVSDEEKELVIEALSRVQESQMFEIEDLIKEYEPQMKEIFGKYLYD